MDKVRDRLERAACALDAAAIPYAVIGGNAVAAWVREVDEAAVRYTQDVDILLRREDLESAKEAMEAAGFVYRHTAGVDMFLEKDNPKARNAVHIIFGREKVRPEYSTAAPDVSQSRRAVYYQVLDLEPLVQMKLTSYRDKDRTHLRDMIDVGLIDATWLSRLSDELATRLKHLLDTPGG